MNLLTTDKILALSRQPARRTQDIALEPIDFSRPFIHEHFTQLYYTPVYRHLGFAHRLRYNQLFAIRVNEVFMMFERDFTTRILERMFKHPGIKSDRLLTECLIQMIEEEDSHHRIFHSLNQAALPEVYGNRERFFSRMGIIERAAFVVATAFPRRLVFLHWFLIAMEEYSMALSRAYLKGRKTESLGELEPNFVQVHGQHLKDESRHVQIDVHMIRRCLEHCSAWSRTLNARMLAVFLKDAVVPKRSGMRVLEYWLAEFPELSGQAAGMKRELLALKKDAAFQKSLFNREMMPRTFDLFDANPEFELLEKVLPGYVRGR